MGRGTNWTSKDDVEMCKSWLHVSEDPTVGKDQKIAAFWDKIMSHMKSKLEEGEPERTLRAAQSRFGSLNTAVSKFVAAHGKVVRDAPSGTNVVDLERRALEIYRHDHPKGKSFDFREAWIILRTNPKWQTPTLPTVNPQQAHAVDTVLGGSPEMQQPHTPTTPNSGNGVISRPVGAKRAKAAIKEGKASNSAVEALQSANLLAIKRQRIMQDQVALGYFRLQEGDVAPELRPLFMKRRARLLKELEEDDVATHSDMPGVPIASPEVDLSSPGDNDVETPSMHSSGYSGVDFDHDNGDNDDLHCYGVEDPQQQIYNMGHSPGGHENDGAQAGYRPQAGGPSNFHLMDFELTLGI